jgi:hypothetical protein
MGVLLYEDTPGWQYLNPAQPSQMGAALADEVFADFPGNGIWKHTISGWQQVSPLDAAVLRGAAG